MTATQQSEQPRILRGQVMGFLETTCPWHRSTSSGQTTCHRASFVVTGQAKSLQFSSTQQWEIRSPSVVLQIPEHIRLASGNPRHWKVPAVNRREAFRRDQYSCQHFSSTKYLTLDHVIPRSKSGTYTWNNMVTACGKRNFTKGNSSAERLRQRLPQQTEMVPRTKSKTTIHPAIAFAKQFWKEQQSADT